MMRTCFMAAVGFVLGATFSACNDPKVEPEGYRQYAEEWCTEYYLLLAECGGPSSELERYIAGCVERQDWDWADACGARIWEGRQCLTSHGCSIVPWDENYQEECERNAQGGCIHPCQEHFAAIRSCPRGEDENGLPYGVL